MANRNFQHILICLQELRERVRPLVRETVSYLSFAIKTGKRLLVEGAQSTILDIDFGKG